MKTLIFFAGIILLFAITGFAEPKGNIEREKFMRAILLAEDAFAKDVPTAKQIELLEQSLAKAKEVNLEFLDFVTPGLGDAWKNFMGSHALHASGLRQTEAGKNNDGLVEQLQGAALWDKWEAFFLPRKAAIFKKLQVNL